MEEEIEIWKWIEGYEGKYEVSTFGRVKSYVNNNDPKSPPPPHIKKLTKIPKGYLVTTLPKYGKLARINILVAKAFIPNPENKPEVNHKDCDKTNNFKSNLEWATRKENYDHAVLNKRLRYQNMLTIEDVKDILELSDTINITQLAKKYNVSKSYISNTISGRRWSNKKMPTKPIESKPIIQIDENSNVIERFQSIGIAARKFGIPQKRIADVLHNRRRVVKGMFFIFDNPNIVIARKCEPCKFFTKNLTYAIQA